MYPFSLWYIASMKIIMTVKVNCPRRRALRFIFTRTAGVIPRYKVINGKMSREISKNGLCEIYFLNASTAETFSNVVSQRGHPLFLSRIKEVYEASRIRHRKEATVFENDESPKTYRRIIQVASTSAVPANPAASHRASR